MDCHKCDKTSKTLGFFDDFWKGSAISAIGSVYSAIFMQKLCRSYAEVMQKFGTYI